MPANPRPALVHPDPGDITLVGVLHALADPERACGTFPVAVAPSTLSHHFKVLREAGVIHQREQGNRRWTTLRRSDLDARFPGLVDTVFRATED